MMDRVPTGSAPAEPGTDREAAAFLREHGFGACDLLLTLGSGQRSPWDDRSTVKMAYAEIPGWSAPGIAGHSGMLRQMDADGVRLLIMGGRRHFYESGRMEEGRVPLRTAARLGVRAALLTNSAGSLRPQLPPGTFVSITSHVRMPVVPVSKGEGGSLASGDSPYWPEGRLALHRAAHTAGAVLADGVLLYVTGPSYETPAEAETGRRMGADVVAMSMAPEAEEAARLGFRVLGVSLVTNMIDLSAAAVTDHETVVAAAARAQPVLDRLLEATVRGLTPLLA